MCSFLFVKLELFNHLKYWLLINCLFRFYHSILDDVYNIQYENNTISQTIASVSTSLSSSLYKFITNKPYTGSKQANNSYVSINYISLT